MFTLISNQMTSYNEDLTSKKGAHRLFDHSSFPDLTILRVRGRNFIVSASYLALNSPFFYDLFYGPNTNGLSGRYELDFDPITFGDMLDIIYPCYKKMNCCDMCTSSLIERLDLAVHLKFGLAVKRLVTGINETTVDLLKILKENSDGYSKLFDKDAVSGKVKIRKDLSDSFEPLPISDKFPDATTIVVGGMAMIVSVSSLSLHSPLLAALLFRDGQVVKDVKVDVDLNSFITFLRATKGEMPADFPNAFLDDLLTLGAQKLYDFIRSENSNKELPKDFKADSKQIENNSINTIGNRERFAQITDSVMELTVQKLTGAQYSITIGVESTVMDLKNMIQDREGMPPDRIRLIFAGKELENEKTLLDYKICHNNTVHLVLGLRC